MKNRVLSLVPLTVVFIVLTYGLTACKNGHDATITTTTLCIQVPPTLSTNDKKMGVEIAAKLEQLKVDGSLKANYERTARSEWGKLSDANAELFIFLQAVDCYMARKTPISDAMARELIAIVRERWGSAKGIAGSTAKISRLEKSKLKETPEGQKSLELYQKLGMGDQLCPSTYPQNEKTRHSIGLLVPRFCRIEARAQTPPPAGRVYA